MQPLACLILLVGGLAISAYGMASRQPGWQQRGILIAVGLVLASVAGLPFIDLLLGKGFSS